MYKKDGTAQGVAKQRLIESLASPDKRIINDPYADRFVLGAGADSRNWCNVFHVLRRHNCWIGTVCIA